MMLQITKSFTDCLIATLTPLNVNVVHLYSAICIASEALFVNHLYSAPSQGLLQAGFRTRHIYDCCHYRHMQAPALSIIYEACDFQRCKCCQC